MPPYVQEKGQTVRNDENANQNIRQTQQGIRERDSFSITKEEVNRTQNLDFSLGRKLNQYFKALIPRTILDGDLYNGVSIIPQLFCVSRLDYGLHYLERGLHYQKQHTSV